MSRSQNPESYADVVAGTFVFRGLSEAETVRLLGDPELSVARFATGSVIYSPEGYRRCLGVVLSGSATVEKRAPGGRMLMSVLKKGDIFGAAALFSTENDYVVDITAKGSAWVLLIPEDSFRRMMQRDFRITENYLSYLTARIRFLNERIDGFIRPSTEERLLLFLEKNARDGVFSPGYSLTALADALCVSRATLYRALDALVEEGRIARDHKTIVLLKGAKKK